MSGSSKLRISDTTMMPTTILGAPSSSSAKGVVKPPTTMSNSTELEFILNRKEDMEETRKLLLAARVNLYDTAGFRARKPLRKSIFYTEPYLTCKHCNHMLFLDVKQVRLLDALYAYGQIESSSSPAFQDSLPEELIPRGQFSLPPCKVCKQIDGYVAGAHDFAEDIVENKQRRIEKVKREHEAASKIAKAYRSHLFKLYGKAVTSALIALRKLQHKAAVRIESLARGRLARRRAQAERNLLVIKTSHPLLVKYALRIFPGKPKTFWYKRKVEIDLIFSDYLDLVEKTGFNPPRIVVERNFAELARRITIRKNELIVFVQKLWRGFMARRIVKYYQTELHRLFGFQVSRVLKLQCVYRGHAARVTLRKLKEERRKEKLMNDYLRTGRDASLLKNKLKLKEQLLIDYQKERKEEYTGRVMLKLPYALARETNLATNAMTSANKVLQNNNNNNNKSNKQSSKQSGKDSNDKSKRGGMVDDHSEFPNNPTNHSKNMTALANNRVVPFKMQIFRDSIHGDDKVIEEGLEIIEADRMLLDTMQQYVIDDIVRREFIHFRIAERGPLGYGLRSGPVSVKVGLAELRNLIIARENFDWRKPSKTTSVPVKDCSRSKAMKFYFVKELEEIAQRAIQRIAKQSKNNTNPKLAVGGDEEEEEEDDVDGADLSSTTKGANSTTKLKKLAKEFRSYNKERLGPVYGQVKSTLHSATTPLKPSTASSDKLNASRKVLSSSSSTPSSSMLLSSKALGMNTSLNSLSTIDTNEDDDDLGGTEGAYDDYDDGVERTVSVDDDGIEEVFRRSNSSTTLASSQSQQLSRYKLHKTRSIKAAERKAAAAAPKFSKLRKDIVFPKEIHFNSMEWLYSDDYDNY